MLPSITGTSADGIATFRHEPTVRRFWPVILPGVQQIRETNKEPWLPEDIFTALVTGGAQLYVFHKEGAFAGFSVLQVMQFPFQDEPVVNIWLGYAVEKGNAHYGVELTRQVASAAGIERIVFASPHEGWTGKFKKITTWYEV